MTMGATTCPTEPIGANGDQHTIVGCGSTNTTGPDSEGLFDCLDCGIWFDPTQEPACTSVN